MNDSYVSQLLRAESLDSRVRRAWQIHRQGKTVIEAFAEGLSVRATATRLGVSHMTVQRLRQKFELTNNRGRK